jgi:hypothetical protein
VHKRREREENREQKVNEIKKQSKMGNTVKWVDSKCYTDYTSADFLPTSVDSMALGHIY